VNTLRVLAVVVEDEGAHMNGRPVKLGEQVANSITLPTRRPRISCNGRGSMTATRPKRVSKEASTTVQS